MQTVKRPGDFLLDRFFPDTDEDTRERAREAFREYALILLRLGERIEEATREAGSLDSAGRPILSPPPA